MTQVSGLVILVCDPGLLTTDGSHILRFWERVAPGAAGEPGTVPAGGGEQGDKAAEGWWKVNVCLDGSQMCIWEDV